MQFSFTFINIKLLMFELRGVKYEQSKLYLKGVFFSNNYPVIYCTNKLFAAKNYNAS